MNEDRYSPLMERYTVPLLFLTALLSLAIRNWHLGAESLWMDEGFTAYQSSFPLAPMLQSLARVDQHPPLYYCIVRFFRIMLGDSEAVLRLPSLIFSVLAVFAVYHGARRLYTGRIALNAALLVAFSAFYTLMAREARSYIFFSLLVLLSNCYFLLMQRGERNASFWYVLFTTVALYTHNFAILICGGQFFYYIGRYIRDRKTVLPLRSCGVVLLSLFLLYLPWLFSLLHQMKANYDLHKFAVTPFLILVVFYSQLVSFHLAYKFLAAWYCVAFLALLGFLYGALTRRREEDWFLLYSFMFLLAVTASMALLTPWKAFEPRYLITYAPVYWILFSRSIDCINSRTIRGALLILVVAINLQSTWNLFTFPSEGKQDWRSAAALVVSKEEKGDRIILIPGLVNYAFNYYYERESRCHNEVCAVFPEEAAVLSQSAPPGRLWVFRAASGLVDPEDRIRRTFFEKKKCMLFREFSRRNEGHIIYVELFADP